MIVHRVRRTVLGGTVCALFLYLLFNAVLNVSGLPAIIENTVGKKLGYPIKLGYVYVNWKGKPTLNSFHMEESPGGLPKQDFVRINNLQINLAWRRIIAGDFDVNEFEMVRSVYFGHLDINLASVPDSRKLFSRLPPVPAHAPSWSIQYFQDNSELFEIKGKNMDYSQGEKPVSLDIKQLQEQDFSARANMKFFPVTDWKFTVKRGIIPTEIWPLEENQWNGEIHFFSRGDTGTLNVDLQGSPGGLRKIYLPGGNLKATIKTGPDTTKIEQLRFGSDYANFEWTGDIRHDTGISQLSLSGDLFVNVKKLGNNILNEIPARPLGIERSFPLHGSFQMSGPVSEPQTSGKLEIKQTVLNVHRPDTVIKLFLSDWAGKINGDSLSLIRGEVQSRLAEFSLSEGYFELEVQNFVSSITGDLVANPKLTQIIGMADIVPRGGFESASSRLNFSTIIGQGSTDLAFVFNDGTVQFKQGEITEIDMLASFSSLEPIQSRFRGEFLGPNKNPWVVNGDHENLRFQGNIQQLGEFTGQFVSSIPSEVFPIKFKRTEAMIQFHDPFHKPGDYFGFVKFDKSSIRSNKLDHDVHELYGEITITPQQFNFNGLYGGIGEGDFQLSGNIRHDTQIETGRWDLQGSGSNFPVSFVVPDDYQGLVKGNFDFDGSVTGSLFNPKLQTELTASRISTAGFPLHNLRGHLEFSSDKLLFSNIEAELAGGELSAFGQVNFGENTVMNGKIHNIELSRAMNDIKFFREQTSGIIDLNFQMKGPTDNLDAWKGEIGLRHREIVLNRFPEVPGLEKIASSEALESKIRIRNQTQVFPIREGKLRFEPLNLVSKGLELNGKGFVALKGNINSEFTLTLKEETLRGYLQHVLGDLYRDIGLSDDNREFDIPFTIKGTVFKPDINIVDDEITKNFRSGLIKSVIPEKLGGKLLDKLIGEIFD